MPILLVKLKQQRNARKKKSKKTLKKPPLGAPVIPAVFNLSNEWIANLKAYTPDKDVTPRLEPEAVVQSELQVQVQGETKPVASCQLCNISSFASFTEQRQHFRSEGHVNLIKQKCQTISIPRNPPPSTTPETPIVKKKSGSPWHWYVEEGEGCGDWKYGVYKRLFLTTEGAELEEGLNGLNEQKPLWTLILLSSGYFAGMVVQADTGQILLHKTLHAYTTRKKAGGSQKRHDAQAGIKGNSVGSSIRRANAAHLEQVLSMFRAEPRLMMVI